MFAEVEDEVAEVSLVGLECVGCESCFYFGVREEITDGFVE